jgi:hypothetical protein
MTTNKRQNAAKWRQRVDRWRQSGLTTKEFAAREGIAPSSLSWWAWKLGKEDKAASKLAPPAFVPVHVVGAASAPGEAESAEALEVTLPGGARIRVPPAFDTQALARVLTVLEAAR